MMYSMPDFFCWRMPMAKPARSFISSLALRMWPTAAGSAPRRARTGERRRVSQRKSLFIGREIEVGHRGVRRAGEFAEEVLEGTGV